MKKLLLTTLLLALLFTHRPAHTGEQEDYFVYLPTITNGDSQPDLQVDPQSRAGSRNFYLQVYLASEDAQANWTGAHNACDPGDTDPAFRDAILLRINYFRAMAGVPPLLGLRDEYNHKAQQAALMMSANRALDHTPPSNWDCYTADGDQAAGSSNLFLGIHGVPAIDGYIYDPGAGNYPVGHRRWILYPQTQHMGTGDIPAANGYPAANALWVFDSNIWNDRPDTREPYVAWPPPGYVPYSVVYPRWSFAYPQADFNAATVHMTHNGAPLPVDVQPVENGYGENTLVWEPDATFGAPPATDQPYTVEIRNILINGAPQTFTYTVTLFDPQPGAAALQPRSEVGQLGPALQWP